VEDVKYQILEYRLAFPFLGVENISVSESS
jgi:hypothetical protein